ITVAMAMRVIGALLVDVLVILPALIAGRLARSTTTLFVFAAIAGVISSVAGFFVSISFDSPASTGIALCSVLLLAIAEILTRRKTPLATTH
ncbi:MAG: metal ABC transporter permease, partial [Spirochaetales bacterium]